MFNLFGYIERKPLHVVSGLFIFHILIALLISWISYSSYLSPLHTGDGFWKFAIDSTLYHQEALTLIDVLDKGEWLFWWSSYTSHMHVKWIALIYWSYGEAYPVLFEIVNSFVWVASVVLIYKAGYHLFSKNVMIASCSTLFLFFPSVLLSSAQLLREPFYILGVCFTILGWVFIVKKDSSWLGAGLIIFGFFFIVLARDYITPIIFSVFFICGIGAIITNRVARLPMFLMMVSIYAIAATGGDWLSPINGKGNGYVTEIDGVENFGTFNQNISGSDNQNISGSDNQNISGSDNKVLNYLNLNIAKRISSMRHGFRNVTATAGSSIDVDERFRNVEDLILYLPRALQIGFLSPFPKHWVSSGKETGSIGRIVSGLETIILYITFIGFFCLLFKNIKIAVALVPVLVLGGMIILLLGYAVPNVGTIYRMRQGLLIPYFMLGTYGVFMLFTEFKLYLVKKSHSV